MSEKLQYDEIISATKRFQNILICRTRLTWSNL